MFKNNNKTKHVRYLFIALTCLLFSQNAFSHNATIKHALPEFYAKYSIKYYGITAAEAHYKLSYTDTGYKFTQNTNLLGIASMFADDTISVLSLIDEVDGQLLLKKHTYIQTGKEKNRNEDIDLSWDTSKKPAKAKITGVVRSKHINLESEEAIWEVLSFQIPLMTEANEETKNYPYKVILKGEIDTYNLELKSSKKVSYGNKEYTALQMVRTNTKKKRELHIWLLPELHNIPVLIENYRKGKVRSSVHLESVQFNNEKPLSNNMDDIDDEF